VKSALRTVAWRIELNVMNSGRMLEVRGMRQIAAARWLLIFALGGLVLLSVGGSPPKLEEQLNLQNLTQWIERLHPAEVDRPSRIPLFIGKVVKPGASND